MNSADFDVERRPNSDILSHQNTTSLAIVARGICVLSL